MLTRTELTRLNIFESVLFRLCPGLLFLIKIFLVKFWRLKQRQHLTVWPFLHQILFELIDLPSSSCFTYAYGPISCCLLYLWMVILGLSSDSSSCLCDSYRLVIICRLFFLPLVWLQLLILGPQRAPDAASMLSSHASELSPAQTQFAVVPLVSHPFWQPWAVRGSFILQIPFPRDTPCSGPLGLLPLLFLSPLSSHHTFLQLRNPFIAQSLFIQTTATFRFSGILCFHMK